MYFEWNVIWVVPNSLTTGQYCSDISVYLWNIRCLNLESKILTMAWCQTGHNPLLELIMTQLCDAYVRHLNSLAIYPSWNHGHTNLGTVIVLLALMRFYLRICICVLLNYHHLDFNMCTTAYLCNVTIPRLLYSVDLVAQLQYYQMKSSLVNQCSTARHLGSCRDHSGNGLDQWDGELHSKASRHGPSPYLEWYRNCVWFHQ